MAQPEAPTTAEAAPAKPKLIHRELVDQRCGCTMCAVEGRNEFSARARCGRCRIPLRVLHYADQTPLGYATCPDCAHHGPIVFEEQSVTDMTAFEDAEGDGYETVRAA